MTSPLRALGAAASLLLATSVPAAEILDSGDGYFVIRHTVNGGAGTIALLVESPVARNGEPSSSSGRGVMTTIADLSPAPGWDATVRKDGGFDRPVEVELAEPARDCAVRFKAIYKPGLTFVDSGRVRCR